jgi:hypothetical protein
MSADVLNALMSAGFGARKAPTIAPAVRPAAPVATEEGPGFDAFAERHPDEAAWIRQAALKGFNFACDMYACVKRGSSLSMGQLDAVRRCVEKSKAFEARRAAEAVAQEVAPVITVARIEEAFAAAKDSGIKRPKLRLDVFRFAPAPAGGANAGAIYVTEAERDGAYLGKVKGGRFIKTRECTADQEAAIVAAASNPGAAAVAYGQRTGTCAICGHELTAGESLDRGIGPICAQRFGW